MNQNSLNPLRFLSPDLQALIPYQSGEQTKNRQVLKLNTNENPYPPSPLVVKAIHELLADSGDILRLYPDPEATALRTIIAQQQGLHPNQVFIGNGSDEVLSFIFKAFFNHPQQSILYPDISYSFYPVYTQFYGLNSIAVPVNENFEIQAEDYFQKNCGIIIANPNAPTGLALDLNQIERIVQANPDHVVVIDEAYIDFGAQSAVQLIARYDNLIICQTTSKSRSLAGLRVGFAMAQVHLINALIQVKNSFNSFPVDRLAITAAVASFEDQAYFFRCCEQIIQDRDHLIEAMKSLGFQVLPSLANFIFVRHSSFLASELEQKLKQKDILVRYFAQPRIEQFLRITIGTPAENEHFLNVLTEILSV